MQTLTILGDYKTALFLRVKPWKMFAAQVLTRWYKHDIGATHACICSLINACTYADMRHTRLAVDWHQHRCDDFGWDVLCRPRP